MNTVVVWLLFFGSTSYQSGTRLLEKEFATEKDCKAVAASMEQQARDKAGFPYLKAICVEARVRD